MVRNLYKENNLLNLKAGYIKYHVDHIIPISKGGLHKPNNLKIISAHDNQVKGSKIIK